MTKVLQYNFQRVQDFIAFFTQNMKLAYKDGMYKKNHFQIYHIDSFVTSTGILQYMMHIVGHFHVIKQKANRQG